MTEDAKPGTPDDPAGAVQRLLATGSPTCSDDLARLLSDTTDIALARSALEATDCTDAIRCEVARRSQDEERRRLAVAHIRDYATLVHLATASGDAATRSAAEARLRELSREQQSIVRDGVAVPPSQAADRARLYVPRFLQQRLAENAAGRAWRAEGTAVLVDISGFTALSERLSRRGREGAEQISGAIGRSFEAILLVAYDNGGSLLKFGGDAMLLWFEGAGHAARGSRAAVLMRRALRTAGRIEVPGAKTALRMAQGVHSGHFDFFAAGETHLEFLPTGPAWSELVMLQRNAAAGEILASPATAALLPDGCKGARRPAGVLLAREPAGHRKLPLVARPTLPADVLAQCLSPPLRAHVLAGGGAPEHRPVTIAFVRYEGVDALVVRDVAQVEAAVARLVETVASIANAHDITFLGSDVDIDGGKLILTAGAPRVIGDDEERMLLALRAIIESDLPFPVRIGVHRGAVFAGDIGPFYRRTYTVMGDAVNLAARLMAEAEPGSILATAQVLDASSTLFALDELEPLRIKGKAGTVRAWSIGRARGSRARQASQQLPLIGRDAEMGVARAALASGAASAGRMLELIGEPGVGKTRLLEALRDEAGAFRTLHTVCEAYTVTTPYALWRDLLREIIGFGRDDAESAVEHALREVVATRAPDLAPWLPLLGIALGLDLPSTPQIDLLTEKNRRAKAHEAVARLLEVTLAEPSLVVIENAHHMDAASAELISYLVSDIANRPWVFALARRNTTGGFAAPDSDAVVRIELAALSAAASLQMVQAQAEHDPLPLHVVDVIARRSGGNPQFLQDLVRASIASGGLGGLPKSAEAATTARIDALAPRDRGWVRRAAVFGLTFHPRMIAWIADEEDGPVPAHHFWASLPELFEEESDGYVHFRQSLLRDAAYEGLPYSVRRRLHGAVAQRLGEELDFPEESASILSLHCHEAGDFAEAWRYAVIAARRAQAVYAYVEAAGLYARALAAGKRLPDVAAELAPIHEAQAEAWYRAGEFEQARDAYAAALRLVEAGPAVRARLLLKRSWVEEKLGKYPRALQWAARARKAALSASDPQAAREAARATSWYASVLQLQGRTKDALRWARRAAAQAEAADDPEAEGEAYYVMGWAFGALGQKGAQELLQRSLRAYQRSGNLVRQAGLLSNLGVVCQWEGRWDEAMAHYEQGRDDSLRIGNTMAAAVSRINIAEILIDRGEVDEAEALLRETLPLWKASRYRFFLGACWAQLGRASLRAGRFEEALRRLHDARASFEHVGAESEVLEADGLIAECKAGNGEDEAGLVIVDGILARGAGNGVAKIAAQLHRVRALALRAQGNRAGARAALEASLAAARKRGSLLDITLALLARLELDDLEGRDAPADVVEEARALIASLKIHGGRALLPAAH
jgi:class 3 adenylate cyclase/tetratricopeptide (TPR) repeat protein